MKRRKFLAFLAGSALAGMPTKAVAPETSLPYTLPTTNSNPWDHFGAMVAEYVQRRLEREGFMQTLLASHPANIDTTVELPRIPVRKEKVVAVSSGELTPEILAEVKAQIMAASFRPMSLVGYEVVCDQSNNSPDNVEQGELIIDMTLHGDFADQFRKRMEDG